MDSEILDLLVILDRSGSMQEARADHEGGLRSFVADQKSLDGDVRFTLVQFDGTNPCEIVYDRVPIDQVGEIQLIPRGSTPLIRAFGSAVAHLRAKSPKPERVITLVITDGENTDSGGEWTKDSVRALVTDLEKQGWQFLFLGANIDAFAEAGDFGVGAAYAMPFQNAGPSVGAAYMATSGNLLRTRQAVKMDSSVSWTSAVAQNMVYTDAQRDDAMGGHDPLQSVTSSVQSATPVTVNTKE